MTRDFNKPKRDNSRPSFRDSSPNRSRDERSPRPARPRLNRETVDRAWESGAQQQHADYRPRTGGGQSRPQGQQQRNNNWRDTSNSSGYSAQNGRTNNRPNQQDNYRDSRDRRDTPQGPSRNFNRPNNGDAPRPSFGQERRNGGGSRFSDRRNSFQSENRRYNENRQSFQDRGQRNDFRRNDRPNSFRDSQPREQSNPRWQSRPSEQRAREDDRRSSANREQFEGDYEYFEKRNTSDTRDTRPARPAERPFRGSHNSQDRTKRPFENNRYGSQERPARRFENRDNDVQPERHVTRLPDGRVLKGPRPAQRKNAQFWTGVSKDTSELVSQVSDTKSAEPGEEVPASEVVDVPVLQETSATTHEPTGEIITSGPIDEVIAQEETPSVDVAPEAPQKRRTRSASAATRSKKSTQSVPSTLKPSRRGFKWPTQD